MSLVQHVKDRNRIIANEGFADIIAVLQAYSLVNATAKKGVLEMHPLVQHYTIA